MSTTRQWHLRLFRPGVCARSGWGREVQSGFTLIELLVVIAIIGVLASLLLPAMDGARNAARKAACAANVRDIGGAARLYSQDHQGYVVSGDTSCSPGKDYWYNALRPYTGLNWLNPRSDADARPAPGFTGRAVGLVKR